MADDELRKVQEELRKRHLFFGSINGQPTPALTAAIAGYQAKKGFARTGLIDSQTLESLGLVRPVPRVADTPFVVVNNDGIRGANGERLPLQAASAFVTDERPIQFERSLIAQDHTAIALAGTSPKPIPPPSLSTKRSSPSRLRRTPPRKETNPLAMAFHTIDRALKFFVGDGDPKKKRAVAKRL